MYHLSSIIIYYKLIKIMVKKSVSTKTKIKTKLGKLTKSRIPEHTYKTIYYDYTHTQVKSITSYLNSKRDGPDILYGLNGHMISIQEWVNDKRCGTGIKFYDDSNIFTFPKEMSNWDNNKRLGPSREWDWYGHLTLAENYYDDDTKIVVSHAKKIEL